MKKNIIANFVGRGWSAAMSLLFVPFYLRFLGIEAYGLVGMFATLLIIFTVFDLGLSTTLNREFARMRVSPDKAQAMRDLLRSMEVIYWAIAVVLGLGIWAFSSVIARHWIHPSQLSVDTTVKAFTLMGAVAVFQWPCALYSGGLMGLQRQVELNVINMIMSTCRGLGALAALALISPTIQVFFVWQLLVSIIQTGVTRWVVLSKLPKGAGPARFKKGLIAEVGHFAAGMTGITLLAILITQLDKVVLSGTLPLKMFGFYSIAATAAGGLSYLVGPVFNAAFPRFTELVTLSDESALASLYHRTCQLMSLMLLPAAVVLILFSRQILLLWTHDPQVAENCYLIMRLLAIGNALNGLMNIPYALQLAHGWTSLNFYGYLISAFFMVPLIFYASRHYGGVGAASMWVCLNAGYFLIAMQIMYSRLLTPEKGRWYLVDIGLPLMVSLLLAGAGKMILGSPQDQKVMFAGIGLVSLVTLAGTAIVLPAIRPKIWALLQRTARGVTAKAASAIIH